MVAASFSHVGFLLMLAVVALFPLVLLALLLLTSGLEGRVGDRVPRAGTAERPDPRDRR
jgi:hypothetical protein